MRTRFALLANAEGIRFSFDRDALMVSSADATAVERLVADIPPALAERTQPDRSSRVTAPSWLLGLSGDTGRSMRRGPSMLEVLRYLSAWISERRSRPPEEETDHD